MITARPIALIFAFRCSLTARSLADRVCIAELVYSLHARISHPGVTPQNNDVFQWLSGDKQQRRW